MKKEIKSPKRCIICKEKLVQLVKDDEGNKKFVDPKDVYKFKIIYAGIFCSVCKIKYMSIDD